MPLPAESFRLAVVTPGGRDGRQVFPSGAGQPEAPGHLPVNFHAYAACTCGTFLSGDKVLPEEPAVLLLIGSQMERAEALLRRLKEAGKTVVVTIKETGLPQISGHFQQFANWSAFRRICALADGAIATTWDTLPLYAAAHRGLKVEFLPPPYPVEEWDLSNAAPQGIFIGTRQLFVTSRSHALALMLVAPLAEELQQKVTVISGRASDLPPMKRLVNKVSDYSQNWHRQFTESAPQVQVIARQMPALEYLRTLAAHRLVFQLDQSAVPGQVAGDALLARVPCVGGNGTAERLVFPDLCGHGRTTGELLDLTRRLLTDESYRRAMIERSVELAREKMCFSTARRQLETLFSALRA